MPWLLALSPGQLAGGLLLYMASLKRIPAGRAALLGLLELVLGPIWVWLFDGEKPGQPHFAGRRHRDRRRRGKRVAGFAASPLAKNRT